MKKIAAALVMCTALAAPAFATKHKMPYHPKAVHPRNPYIKHPNPKGPHHFHLLPHFHKKASLKAPTGH